MILILLLIFIRSLLVLLIMILPMILILLLILILDPNSDFEHNSASDLDSGPDFAPGPASDLDMYSFTQVWPCSCWGSHYAQPNNPKDPRLDYSTVSKDKLMTQSEDPVVERMVLACLRKLRKLHSFQDLGHLDTMDMEPLEYHDTKCR